MPVAVSCSDAPTAIEGVVGVTVIETSVAFPGAEGEELPHPVSMTKGKVRRKNAIT